MTKNEQADFIGDLLHNVAQSLLDKIHSGKVPEEWNGHELRCWVADTIEDSARLSTIRKEPRSRRARDYRNTVLVNNLLR
jgi:hypothetical protein